MSEATPTETKIRFLVVDDEAEVRATIVQLLHSFGYVEVLEAIDAHDAMSRLQSHEIDFVISDWQMPGMTGLQFLKTLRSQPKTQHIPFIIVTNPGSDEVMKIEEAVGAQVDAYVIKPFRGEVLNAKIGEVLSRKENSPSGPKGVLVVDDDAQVRSLVVEILGTLGHGPVFQASNGKEALDQLKANAAAIGLIISDWEMPEVTGISLLQKIRADRELAKIPFIMITSQTSIEHLKLKEALNAHVNHYLMKPFTSKDLQAKIQSVLSKALIERQVDTYLQEAAQNESAGKFEEARDRYRDALQLDPKNIRAHLALADNFTRDPQAPDFDEAIKVIKHAIQLHPGSDRAHVALAQAFENAKSLDKAVHLLEEAALKLPWSENIQFHLGRLHLKLGHGAPAATCLKKALEIKPDHKDAQELLKKLPKS